MFLNTYYGDDTDLLLHILNTMYAIILGEQLSYNIWWYQVDYFYSHSPPTSPSNPDLETFTYTDATKSKVLSWQSLKIDSALVYFCFI